MSGEAASLRISKTIGRSEKNRSKEKYRRTYAESRER
jgi:hypothetical protein